jgi:two-component system sensor histidine kinase DegS
MEAAPARSDARERRFEASADVAAAQDASVTPAEATHLQLQAAEAERRRIAREIHDGPAQALANAIFETEYLGRLAATDPAAALERLPELREGLQRDLEQVRALITSLRPPDATSLDAGILEAADRVRRSSGTVVTATLQAPEAELDDEQRSVVLRVAQEALHNVRKHAGASTVAVETTLEDDTWVLEIRDDGRGFDDGALADPGRRTFGLAFMRERAELIGARFDVRSRPDGGTVVRLTVPTGARTGTEESR